MSPLDDLDIDRVSDKVRLVVREELDKAFHAHMEDHHKPIVAKMEALQESFWKWSGGIATITFLIGLSMAFVAR